MIEHICPNCNNIVPHGNDLSRADGIGYAVDGRRKVFCNIECYNQYKNQFKVETPNQEEVFKIPIIVNGDIIDYGFTPYWQCFYYFQTLEECIARVHTLEAIAAADAVAPFSPLCGVDGYEKNY